MSESELLRFLIGIFLITAHWGLMAILTGVVSDNMITVTQEQEREENANRQAVERSQILQKLRRIVQRVDTSGNGEVSHDDLSTWLRCPENVLELRKESQLLPLDVIDVWEVLQLDGEVRCTDLVEALRISKKSVTEKSLMRVEARMRLLHRETAEIQYEVMDAFQALRHAQLSQTEMLINLIRGGHLGDNLASLGSRNKKVANDDDDGDTASSVSSENESAQGISHSSKKKALLSKASFFWTTQESDLTRLSIAAADSEKLSNLTTKPPIGPDLLLPEVQSAADLTSVAVKSTSLLMGTLASNSATSAIVSNRDVGSNIVLAPLPPPPPPAEPSVRPTDNIHPIANVFSPGSLIAVMSNPAPNSSSAPLPWCCSCEGDTTSRKRTQIRPCSPDLECVGERDDSAASPTVAPALSLNYTAAIAMADGLGHAASMPTSSVPGSELRPSIVSSAHPPATFPADSTSQGLVTQ